MDIIRQLIFVTLCITSTALLAQNYCCTYGRRGSGLERWWCENVGTCGMGINCFAPSQCSNSSDGSDL